MMITSIVIGSLGFISLLCRRNFLGVLMGLHILFLGCSQFFVSLSLDPELKMNAIICSFLILLTSVIILAVGYFLMIRLFFQKQNVKMSVMQTLKN